MDIYRNEVYNIRKAIERVADIHQEILSLLKRPENGFLRVLNYIVLFVGALSLLNLIELVRQWVIGG